jgi:hypothetical protein
MMKTCDIPTEQERATGRTDGPVKLHRWKRPVTLGDKCYCGERIADAILVKVLNGGAA